MPVETDPKDTEDTGYSNDVLTDSEREALADGDVSEGPEAGPEAGPEPVVEDSGDDDNDNDDEGVDDTGDDGADDISDDDDAGDADDGADAEDDAGDAPESEPDEPKTPDPKTEPENERDTGKFATEYAAPEPTDSKAELTALQEQFDAGDIELAEFLDGRDAIKTAALEHKIRRDLTEDNRQQRWAEDQREFMADNPEFNNDIMMGALQGALNHVWGAEEHTAKSGLAKLKLAARAVREAGVFGAPAKADEPVAVEPQGKEAADGKREALKGRGKKATTKTLTNVPAADKNDAPVDKYAHMAELEGVAIEKAFHALSPEQQEEWLAG